MKAHLLPLPSPGVTLFTSAASRFKGALCPRRGRGNEFGLSSQDIKQQFSSAAQSCPSLCDPMDCNTPASLSITNSWSLLKLMSIESVTSSNHLILCRPLLLLFSIFPSIRVFSSESFLLIRWPKHWSFSFSPSNEYSGLISFRMDWLDLLAVQGTLKSLLFFNFIF